MVGHYVMKHERIPDFAADDSGGLFVGDKSLHLFPEGALQLFIFKEIRSEVTFIQRLAVARSRFEMNTELERITRTAS